MLVAVELSALALQGLCRFVQVIHLLSRKFMRFVSPRLVLFHRRLRVMEGHARSVTAQLVLSAETLCSGGTAWLLPYLVLSVLIAEDV